MGNLSNTRSRLSRSSDVSIGMPVFNGAATLRHAIDSLLRQTYGNFELLISDNASTDSTEQICRAYTSSDRRIIYFRQPVNRGPSANFQFVLDQAVGEYFMWAASDDVWADDFILTNRQVLASNPACVASIGRVVFVTENNVVAHASRADSPLTGTLHSRLRQFIRDPSDNSRFYSLYRRYALRNLNLEGYTYHAADWFVIAKVLLEGEFHTVDRVQLTRLIAPLGKYARSAPNDNKGRITFGFPLLAWTLEVCKLIPIYTAFASALDFARLNLRSSPAYHSVHRKVSWFMGKRHASGSEPVI